MPQEYQNLHSQAFDYQIFIQLNYLAFCLNLVARIDWFIILFETPAVFELIFVPSFNPTLSFDSFIFK
ncbi:MAG: hypothetical protein MUE85_24540 [Microscillaceae bacterium]|jgi:hypothetical protein|nr:hypothetical protein [Microscillaceae bacterium]